MLFYTMQVARTLLSFQNFVKNTRTRILVDLKYFNITLRTSCKSSDVIVNEIDLK